MGDVLDRLRTNHARSLEVVHVLLKRNAELTQKSTASSEKLSAVQAAHAEEIATVVAECEGRLAECRRKCEKLEEQLRQAGSVSEVAEQLRASEAALRESSATVSTLSDRVKVLEAELARERRDAERKVAEAQAAGDAQVAALEASLAAAHARHTKEITTREEREGKLKAALQDLGTRLKRAVGQRKELSERSQALAAQVQQLLAERRRADAAQGGEDRANAVLEQLRLENAALLRQIADMREKQKRLLAGVRVGGKHARFLR